jgi:hypothetical protein
VAGDKPFLAMNDIEWIQAWDRIGGSLEEELLQEAREGKATVEVAAAVLARASGVERVVLTVMRRAMARAPRLLPTW